MCFEVLPPCATNPVIPNGIIPIYWFGDRKMYANSKVKVVTVGLNPSDKEFREKPGDPFSTHLRFPLYEQHNPKNLNSALNAYFKTNPYRWFNAFENVLNGMEVSYYDKGEFPSRALHTDICSPWATDPTWSKLSPEDKKALYTDGHRQWVQLIAELKPDIILSSLSRAYMVQLGIEGTETEFCRFDVTKDGSRRNAPEIVSMYTYNGIPVINGRALNIPFGGMSNACKQAVGREIKKRLLQHSK